MGPCVPRSMCRPACFRTANLRIICLFWKVFFTLPHGFCRWRDTPNPKPRNNMNIRNIIFDLGGVLLNIDYHRTINAFKALGLSDFNDFYNQAAQIKLFDHFDRGDISAGEFRDALRRISGLPLSDEQIDSAWNAMLLDFPDRRIKLLESVRKNYRTFLLSNTNTIHYRAYMSYLKNRFGFSDLGALFEKQYLSYEMGMRKPDSEAFELILSGNNLQASETLFIDDSYQHVKGAADAGLPAVYLDVEKMEVTGLFNKNAFLYHPIPGLIA